MILQVRVEPIENAPKDGTRLTLLCPKGAMDCNMEAVRGEFCPSNYKWFTSKDCTKQLHPTHYLPDGFPALENKPDPRVAELEAENERLRIHFRRLYKATCDVIDGIGIYNERNLSGPIAGPIIDAIRQAAYESKVAIAALTPPPPPIPQPSEPEGEK